MPDHITTVRQTLAPVDPQFTPSDDLDFLMLPRRFILLTWQGATQAGLTLLFFACIAGLAFSNGVEDLVHCPRISRCRITSYEYSGPIAFLKGYSLVGCLVISYHLLRFLSSQPGRGKRAEVRLALVQALICMTCVLLYWLAYDYGFDFGRGLQIDFEVAFGFGVGPSR